MSNITLFSSGSAIPEYLIDKDNVITKELAGSSGFKQISIKGGVWRMIIGGEEVAKNENRSMNLVVLAAGKGITRTYYAGKFEEGKSAAPDCWSAEGVVPAPEIKAPKGATCALCPMNIEGSGEGKSRACRFSKRLAVAVEGDIGGNIYRLTVPAKSYFGRAEGDKMPLQAFGKFLAGHSIPITGIVTEARFDTAEAVPVMKFKAVRPLTKPEWELAQVQGASAEAMQAIEVKMTPKKDDLPALPSAFSAPIAAVAAPEPTKRPSKKPEAAAPAVDISAVLDEWGSDDE